MTLVQDELAYHIFIQATAQDVWDALTGPGWTRKYGYRTLVKYDLQPGGIYLAYASGRRYGQRAGDLIISGEVLEAEPPKRLVQTWHPMFDTRAAAEPPTRLTWEIHEEQTGLTAVTVRHECPGAPQTAALASAEAAGSGRLGLDPERPEDTAGNGQAADLLTRPARPRPDQDQITRGGQVAQIVVMGGGLNGLTAGMLLARDGHQVTVLERDAAGPRGRAADLWQRWDRRGVNQFRQLHFMLPRWRAEMERELPEVISGLEDLGGVRTSMLGALPDEMTGGKRDGDERFETVTGRRPVLEAAVAHAAKRTDGLTVCRGVAATGLVTGHESMTGVPHVTGVTVGGATVVHADLVVDATGRRSPVSGMLAAVGARRPDEEKEDCGFVYYARHFRSADGSCPPARERLLQHFEGVSILTLPCDSGTWGVALVTSARDKDLRALRAVPAWEAALSLFPSVAHWGDAQPITGVQVIAAIEDRHRRHVVDGEPVVTGLVALGDAWACTNPSLGRGASIGLLHACALRDLLREVGPDEPERLARRFDEATQTTVGPLYRATLEFDRHRLAEINAEITGQAYEPGDPAWDFSKALYAAAACDPDVLRAYTSVAALTATPADVLAEPGMLDKVITVGSAAPRYSAPGPARAELLAAVVP